jgi:hypothetical protein
MKKALWLKTTLIIIGGILAYRTSPVLAATDPCVENICFKPTPTDWSYSLCENEGADSFQRQFLWCITFGGNWGVDGRAGCTGQPRPLTGDSIASDFAIFSSHASGRSCIISQDSGWGASIPPYSVDSSFCNSGQTTIANNMVISQRRTLKTSSGGNHCFGGVAGRSRDLRCPAGTESTVINNNLVCFKKKPQEVCGVGNPILVFSGDKIQKEVDFTLEGLEYARRYNSAGSIIPHNIVEQIGSFFGTHGHYWRTSLDYSLYKLANQGQAAGYALSFPEGFIQTYNTNLKPISDQFKPGVLTATGTRFTYQDNGFKLVFDNSVKPTSLEQDGKTFLLTYTSSNVTQKALYPSGEESPVNLPQGMLIGVKTANAPLISFRYDTAGKMVQASGGGYSVKYHYDTTDKLIKVTKNANQERIYHYENNSFPHALTGITDENGKRYATWVYDAKGRAISSEHAGGIDKTQLDFTFLDDATAPRVKVTNPLGKESIYYYKSFFGQRKITKIEGLPSENCAAANKAYTYYDNGSLKTKTDWQGRVTEYIRDDKGREIERIEAKGTPEARTIKTEYHPTLNLKTKVTEPKTTTLWEYFDNGQLKSTTTQPRTTD